MKRLVLIILVIFAFDLSDGSVGDFCTNCPAQAATMQGMHQAKVVQLSLLSLPILGSGGPEWIAPPQLRVSRRFRTLSLLGYLSIIIGDLTHPHPPQIA